MKITKNHLISIGVLCLAVTILSGCQKKPVSDFDKIVAMHEAANKNPDVVLKNINQQTNISLAQFRGQYQLVKMDNQLGMKYGDLCLSDTEELRERSLDTGELHLICMPTKAGHAYDRDFSSKYEVSFSCDPLFRPGFLLIGSIVYKDKDEQVNYECVKG